MPSYTFRLPANTAGLPVTVYAATDTGFTTSVASGTLDGSATFTTTLPVGNYTARSRSALRNTWYVSSEELATRFDPEAVDSEALRAAFGTRAAALTDQLRSCPWPRSNTLRRPPSPPAQPGGPVDRVWGHRPGQRSRPELHRSKPAPPS